MQSLAAIKKQLEEKNEVTAPFLYKKDAEKVATELKKIGYDCNIVPVKVGNLYYYLMTIKTK